MLDNLSPAAESITTPTKSIIRAIALSRAQQAIVGHLDATPSIQTVVQIAAAVGLAYATVSSHCRILAEMGKIKRMPGSQSRYACLSYSEEQ